jgi:hypothetical protein
VSHLPSSARAFRLVALLSLAWCGAERALAQSTATIEKQHKSVQTGPTTTVDNSTTSDGIWRFSASVATTATGTISFTPPGGTAQALPLDTANGAYDVHVGFSGQSGLNAAYPSGTYLLTFNGQTSAVALTGDLYPNVPVATVSTGIWSNGTLFVTPSQAVTITINFTTNYLAGSAHSSITLSGAPGVYTASTDTGTNFAVNQLSLTIPANSLQTGQVVNVKLDLDNLVYLNLTNVPGFYVAGIYEQENSFIIQAGSAPTAPAPVFTVQPTALTVNAGSTAIFSAVATGTPAPTYQWYKGGNVIAGATGPRLVLSGTTSSSAGGYNCVATNAGGSTTSNAAGLTVVTSTNPGRLINLSVLSNVQGTLTAGFVVGGAGTSGAEPLLIRASGPALTAFGVSSILPDPSLTVIPQGSATAIASNAGWGSTAANQSAVTAADTATGAFPLTNASSHDAAVVLSLAPGGDTVQVKGSSGDSGTALAEVYDATANYTVAAPRLINLSCLNTVSKGGSLTAGFVIGGATAKTVLVRATGPALTAFGVTGVMPDPQITLQLASTGATLVSNSGWAGDPQITAADAATGAFTLTNPASLDSAVLVSLPPGAYTAQVTSVSSTAGSALVEVYEVP